MSVCVGLRGAELNLLNEICFGLLWFKTLSFTTKLLRAEEKYQVCNLSLKGKKTPPDKSSLETSCIESFESCLAE